MGTSAGSAVFLNYGWRAGAALNVGWTVATLLFLLARGPHVPRHTWLGWTGGSRPRLASHADDTNPAREVEKPGLVDDSSIESDSLDHSKSRRGSVINRAPSEVQEVRRSTTEVV